MMLGGFVDLCGFVAAAMTLITHHLDDHHRGHRRTRLPNGPHPGLTQLSGFVMTAILGIVGAFAGTYLGQLLQIGWGRSQRRRRMDHVDHRRDHRTGCVEPDHSKAWSMIPRRGGGPHAGWFLRPP